MSKAITELKMSMLKKAINYLVPKVSRLATVSIVETPQSRLILRTWKRLESTLEREEHTGCFNDTNFKALLEASKKALVFLCEHDKYYKRWLGYLALVLCEEIAKMRLEFDYAQAYNMTTRPLMITEEEVERHKEALFIFNLSGYLYSYELVPETSLQGMKEERERNGGFRLPTVDSDAYVKLFYTPDRRVSFTMFFKERHLDDEQ